MAAPAPCASSAADAPGDLKALVTKVVPTVVAVKTRRVLTPSKGAARADEATRIERAQGSGFLVSPDGIIATNKHVVQGAYSVTVALAGGKEVSATVAYLSPVIDVAFLKVQADQPLPTAMLARDDALEVGQRVVAIGNPEGLGISASAGIVSALDRNLKTSPYDRYIQTDAAINPGNSGGPLFDLAGQVVGMNSLSWVAGEGAGSDGLGFAIPSSSIAFLVDQLRKDGRIGCGTLGLKGQKLSAAMRDALGFPGHGGVIVATVDPNSAAAQANLEPGDVVEYVDGQELHDVTMLNHLACFALGRAVELQVWRDGRSETRQVVMTRVEDITGHQGDTSNAPPRFASARDLGLTLAPVDDRTRRDHDLPDGSAGLVVTAVERASEADNAGIGRGDVIKSLQKLPLPNRAAFDDAMTRLGRSGHRYLIALVGSKGGDRWITLPVRLETAR